MKTVVIGDLHGNDIWHKIIYQEEPNRVIFLGDYFDSFTLSPNTQWHNFINILSFKDYPEIELILLVGNHDHHYLPYIGNSGTSGYNKAWNVQFGDVLLKADLKMAYQFDNFLFSHAGVSYDFYNKYFKDEQDYTEVADNINALFHYKPRDFIFNTQGSDPYGDDVFQSPIWIRPRSLMQSNKNTFLHEYFIQVFGHTTVKKVDKAGHHTGGRYYNIDTINTSGEYMVITDCIEFKKLKAS